MGSRQPFPHKPKPKTSIIFLAITISASLLILSAILYFLYYLWYSLVHKSRTSPFDAASPLNKLQKFSYKELKNATNNFSASNSIGKGGSGTVFRGILPDGKLVAVKLLDSNLLQSEQEFQNELKTLGGLKPCPRIVSLIGFCVEKDNRLVVFEYMPNRSFNYNYNNNDFNLCLNWGIRFNIILDVAKALAFLHLECEPAVIHGDVKPSNVLLDSEFRAKLSDFGLSRFKLEEGELSSTTSMRGTLCYVAPEYNGYGYLMEKSDIYSLGVLVLVIVSGRRPLHVLASPMKLEKANLISWARSLAYSGNILELVDEQLKDEYNKEQASLCINLALACLQKMPELRPDIGDIVKVLKGD
ncbi:putative receptor-like protein kinase at1g80870, partial [Phtheirospermum japonicum]